MSHAPLPATPRRGDLATLALTSTDGARAELTTHGAHVLSWTTRDGRERLFLSARSAYRAGTAIRGGVPVIFPQFSDVGPLPRHGFARTTTWELVEAHGERARLRLADTEATRALWPRAFVAELTASIGDDALRLSLEILNAGGAALAFTAALHTYLRVADVARARLHGLRGVRFRDQTAAGAERTDDAERLAFEGEVDRVYLDAPSPVTLLEDGRPSLTVTMDGFRDTVVWNPGPERGAALADLEPDGASRFVCVEAAVVGTPVTLAPGARWTGTQTLSAG